MNFALRLSINENLSRQRVQSHGRFEIVSPCKQNSKKATPRTPEIHQLIVPPEVLKDLEKNLKTDSSKTDYSLNKTCSDLQRQKHLKPEIINAAKKIHDMFTDDDMKFYEKAVDKMVKLVNTTSSKLKQPE